jgi:hypothetical protein
LPVEVGLKLERKGDKDRKVVTSHVIADEKLRSLADKSGEQRTR